ncbi:flagellar biosynthesis protein FlhB [Phenylobacterium sp. LH3H17]|uniref:flagellar biosynthesis protein FlhB n=1 Tax=Phenylobacterium sp. LH3H17 TaxID=2903901 RepID=UPI0020C99A1F|nr:flagellar biosynthesis protein FlhB [Phenylobacterium sp. LH3H17]UTP40777.1 flagellar biosynthesis protein FlhB [Phenylobacterium sp. LH3H17]
MAEENDAASKTEEPTPGKLQKAREKGDVVKTPDLAMLASFAGAAGVLAVAGGWMSNNLANELLPFIAHPHDMRLEGGGGVEIARHSMMAAAPILLAVLVVAALLGAGGNLVQTGFMYSPEKLKPDWKKVSPMGGLKRMLGPDGLMQFFKSLVKILMVAWVGYVVVKPYVHPMQELSALDPTSILPLVIEILRKLVFAVAGLMLVIAGFDWFWQRQRFMKKMMMTKEELKEEFKNTEGDPHIKAKRRQIQIQRSRRRMMAAVPTATMVIMNPTHYAVALKYEPGETAAPQCVAKGMDAVALKIRALAEEAGVPVIEDAPLARALYAAVELDDFIPATHYEAVAKLIGFIMQTGRRAAGAA